eukprot:CAMPEP_0185269558 /NCGR_PEP_ID=MMETSP1359-20130426/40201_1 /TAXON_ID=552665 /ORGANISM="Bigelowiella longifila, Strain CCMP242" /LENGTH=136 /DNA_ID=CAMNT_0027860781 /DNA_START=16 /DNA_END=426 /DNA_ORIENTATION=+
MTSIRVAGLLLLCIGSIEAKKITFFGSQGGSNACQMKAGSNDACIVRLNGNPTTGYTWVATMEGEGVVTVGEPEYQRNEAGDKKIVGSGGVFEFRIAPKGNGGSNTVKFNYVRPWEAKNNAVQIGKPDYQLFCQLE